MPEFERRVELAIPSPSRIFTPAVTVILVLMVTGYALIHYAEGFIISHFAISASGVFGGKIWQLVTYSFIDMCGLTLIFNGLLVLFVGSAIEREWRTKSFVLLWLVVSIVCGIIWVLFNWLTGLNYIGAGSGACGFGIIAVFGLLYRRKRFLVFFWAVEAQYIAWGLIAIGIILGIPQPITWIWVLGALVAYLYVKLRWRLSMGGGAIGRKAQSKPRGFVDID